MTKIDPFMGVQIIQRHPHLRRIEHVIVVVLDPGEAEAVAGALGVRDAAATELYEAAAEARALDAL